MTSSLPPYVFAPAPNVFNFNPTGANPNLQKWRAALARVRSGSGNATLYCLGDSTTFGEYSNSNTDTGNLVPGSYPTQLARCLNAAGVNATSNNFAGGGYNLSAMLNRQFNDGRLSFGGGWAVAASPNVTAGGGFLNLTNGSTVDTLSFTPTTACDTFTVLYAKSLFAGNFTLKIGAGAAQTVASYATGTGLGVATITGTASLSPLAINYLSQGAGGSATGVYILGILGFNSAVPSVQVVNAGWGGSGTTNSPTGWSQNLHGYDPLPAAVAFGQDLTLVNLGINDWNASLAPASYQANLQTIVANAMTVGDVVLVTPNPTNSAPVAIQQAYVAACYQVASANNLCLIDNNARYGSYANANALGFMGNGVHPGQKGYADNAAAIARVLLSV